jgi:hypothetical protein
VVAVLLVAALVVLVEMVAAVQVLLVAQMAHLEQPTQAGVEVVNGQAGICLVLAVQA